ncbi:hypothetical protein Q7P37_008169 [Cladosporium fusiforme]
MTERIPMIDLSWANDVTKKPLLLEQLRAALFDVGFLYVINHGVSPITTSLMADYLPSLFALPTEQKASMSKAHTPHFLGYSGFAEETTLGKQDLREQFDFATELPQTWLEPTGDYVAERGTSSETARIARVSKNGTNQFTTRDFHQLYWRLRGPNQWPEEESLPGFRATLTQYHNEIEQLSYRFAHLIEEAFGIAPGTFDHFFGRQDSPYLPPQHRIKLLRYPPAPLDAPESSQGVGAHKDSSGWLTFLYQVGEEEGLEVLSSSGKWLRARPIPNTFVVNFGNAFEAATEGAVKATIHRVIAPGPTGNIRYSILFFMGLPLDMSVSEIRRHIPESVRRLRKEAEGKDGVDEFLDPRWDSLGESQLRKWIRSHREVGEKWYGRDVVAYYTQ